MTWALIVPVISAMEGPGRTPGSPRWGPARTSWTLPLDALRLGPADDATAVTTAQLRETVARITAAGQWKAGDPDIV